MVGIALYLFKNARAEKISSGEISDLENFLFFAEHVFWKLTNKYVTGTMNAFLI